MSNEKITFQGNLYERMLKVSMEVMNVEKNMLVGTTNGKQSYKAVADFDVVMAVKKAEAKFGVISVPVKQELISTELLKTESTYNGQATVKYQYHDVVKMTMRFINVDKPEEFIEIEAYGRGLDSADKGFGKASTYARKYCLLNGYKIATGEDPDKDISVEQNYVNQQTAKEPKADVDAIIASCQQMTNADEIKAAYQLARKSLNKADADKLYRAIMQMPVCIEASKKAGYRTTEAKS